MIERVAEKILLCHSEELQVTRNLFFPRVFYKKQIPRPPRRVRDDK